MMIFYDHQAFSMQEYGGISRYFSELISGINQRTHHQAYVSARYSNNAHAHDRQLVKHHFLKTISFPKKAPILSRLNKAFTCTDLVQRTYDLIHSTYYDPFTLTYGKPHVPVIVTFYDMIHERLQHDFARLAADKQLMKQKRVWANKATRLIAISEHTKQDMIELLNVPASKIEVIYLGNSLQVAADIPTVCPNPSSRPYVLFVGNRSYYKNFPNFLLAIQPLLLQYDLRVICAGGGPFHQEENALIQSLRIANRMEQRAIDDTIATALYTQATLFVLPSLYEGFGLPILEAFACNCPCVVSDRSSLPEIGGSAVLYFDPTDVDSIRATIRRALDNKQLMATLTEAGQKQLTRFSWQRTLENTIALYESV